MITPYKPNGTTGEKLRVVANKLNEGNKLSICSLLLVAGLAVTLAVMSQEISKERTTEIRSEFKDIQIGKKKILLKPKLEEASPESKAAWEYVKSFAIETAEVHVRTLGVIHSVQTGEEKPHAVVSIIQNAPLPTMMIVPKDIFTDEGWNIIVKAKPNPEFGNKWGYKVPDTHGIGTTPGSATAIEDSKATPITPTITQPTMPVERTITNTKGVAIEGTILAKTNTSISFQRKGNSAPIEIKLDMLSPEDQAFIATLVAKQATKPTVLFFVNQPFDETEEVRTWLTNNGFDLKIGVIKAGGYGPASYKMPAEVPYVTIDPVEVIDQFDIVWINQFSTQETKGKEAFSHFAIVNHRNKNRELVVIPTHSRLAKKDRFTTSENYYKGSPKLDEEDRPHVKADENIIFCSNKSPHSTDEKMRVKLLEAIKAELAK